MCTVIDGNAAAMYCLAPEVDLPSSARRRRQALEELPPDQQPVGVTLGFIMDGVSDLLQWSVNSKKSFQYFQNPNYATFEIIIREGDENLQIKVLVSLSIFSSQNDQMMQLISIYAF